MRPTPQRIFHAPSMSLFDSDVETTGTFPALPEQQPLFSGQQSLLSEQQFSLIQNTS
jgi:hypothetical protein